MAQTKLSKLPRACKVALCIRDLLSAIFGLFLRPVHLIHVNPRFLQLYYLNTVVLFALLHPTRATMLFVYFLLADTPLRLKPNPRTFLTLQRAL